VAAADRAIRGVLTRLWSCFSWPGIQTHVLHTSTASPTHSISRDSSCNRLVTVSWVGKGTALQNICCVIFHESLLRPPLLQSRDYLLNIKNSTSSVRSFPSSGIEDYIISTLNHNKISSTSSPYLFCVKHTFLKNLKLCLYISRENKLRA
jgi:hypothetical protein